MLFSVCLKYAINKNMFTLKGEIYLRSIPQTWQKLPFAESHSVPWGQRSKATGLEVLALPWWATTLNEPERCGARGLGMADAPLPRVLCGSHRQGTGRPQAWPGTVCGRHATIGEHPEGHKPRPGAVWWLSDLVLQSGVRVSFHSRHLPASLSSWIPRGVVCLCSLCSPLLSCSFIWTVERTAVNFWLLF